MTKTDHVTELVEETKALIKEVEAGDTANAAWLAIQDRVRRISDGRTQRETGRLLSKSDTWVSTVLAWDFQDPKTPTPHAGPRGAQREASTAKKVLRDPEQRRQVIADLDHNERAELVNEVAKAPAPAKPHESSQALRDHMEDAVAVDLSAQVAKLIAGASRIDLLLAERGAEFRRIDAEQAERFDADLERVMNTIRDVRGELLKHREIEVTS
jgi:hypothetical protein